MNLGALLRQTLPPGSKVDTPPIAGAVGNPRAVAEEKADLAFGLPNVGAWAPHGTVPFKEPRGSLRALAGGWDQYYLVALAAGRDAGPAMDKSLQKHRSNTRVVLLPCAVAGIIVAVIAYSGLGTKFTALMVLLSGGWLPAMLVLAALGALILGCGMPTTSAYIMAAVLVAPALVLLKVDPLVAHFFIFYFAILSMVTPPVALAAYAPAALAAAITDFLFVPLSRFWRTWFAAVGIPNVLPGIVVSAATFAALLLSAAWLWRRARGAPHPVLRSPSPGVSGDSSSIGECRTRIRWRYRDPIQQCAGEERRWANGVFGQVWGRSSPVPRWCRGVSRPRERRRQTALSDPTRARNATRPNTAPGRTPTTPR